MKLSNNISIRFVVKCFLLISIFLLSQMHVFSQPGKTGISSIIADKNALFQGNYIGGYRNGDVFSKPIYKSTIKIDPSVTVKNTKELLSVLAAGVKHSVIYLNDNSVFDLTGLENIVIPPNTTLISGRGKNGSPGALISTNSLKTNPLFTTGGGNIHLIGLRFKGPDSTILNPSVRDKFLQGNIRSLSTEHLLKKLNGREKRNFIYGIGNSRGIEILHKNVTIENCEIYNWSHAAISIRKGQALIKYSYIHHNQRVGLGYGIMNNAGTAVIVANIFKDNRHAIAGTGAVGTSYVAKFNVILPSKIEQGHQFDMHGGRDRKESNNIAGQQVTITNNFIFYDRGPSVLIRGTPQKTSIIEDNIFIHVSSRYRIPSLDSTLISNLKVKANLTKGNVVRQTYGKERVIERSNRYTEILIK